MDTPAGVGVRGRGRHILILLADDNPLVREATSRMLRFLGCDVDVVCDGDQAVIAAARKVYDFILLDLQMPSMGGLEAADLIRRDVLARNDAARIVIITAETELDQFWPHARIERVLTKPIRANDLKNLIHVC